MLSVLISSVLMYKTRPYHNNKHLNGRWLARTVRPNRAQLYLNTTYLIRCTFSENTRNDIIKDTL